jgi:hypothetical protein
LADDDLYGPGRLRAFSPFLAPGERKRLHAALTIPTDAPPSFVAELRALARRYIDDGDSLKLRAVCLLVADLHEHGWRIEVEGDKIVMEPPGLDRSDNESVDQVKERVRRALHAARSRQLEEPSVRQFLTRVERRTLRNGIKASVLDLVDDGAALAKELKQIQSLAAADRGPALARLVQPEIEVCDSGSRCADTGLVLTDVWRYFRHTWAHEYRAIPGRQMLILVRNAARPNRPIMGIAMLASPVMRLGTRDRWIGWLRESAEERLIDGRWQPAAFADALLNRLDASIAGVRWDDLATAAEILHPSETVALRLEQRAAGAAFAREAQLKAFYDGQRDNGKNVRPHRGEFKSGSADTDWRNASDDLLFVRKRAEGLAQLLRARHVFSAAGLADDPRRSLQSLFRSKEGQRALDVVLAELRKAGLSSQVADVSICGAVHPYNGLLVGKLVAMLLTSREVRDAYAARYCGQVSVIASQMAGFAVTKPAQLRILTTTSLYGVGSSQYNRLALRAADFPELGHDIKWSAIGKSLTGGFGTLHLSGETTQALRNMAIFRHDARRVNNRFGEGTSPRLRQIREGLDALGLKSDAVLHHATPRIFYGCELEPSSRDALVGMATVDNVAPSCDSIAVAWQQRWLTNRIMRPETLEALALLGPTSVRASLHADTDGQFSLPILSD